MTDYDKLAQRIVAQEIGESICDAGGMRYILPVRVGEPLTEEIATAPAKQFCHDGRVVLAVMKLVGLPRLIKILSELYRQTAVKAVDTLAIIEACLDALEVGDE